MGSTPEPADELRRQAALYALAILDTEPEEEFDRIARLAQRLLSVPAAIVSFMDHDRQWYKARIGVDATEAERTTTFCTHVIADGQPLVVEDATADPRFAGNPHVLADGGVRFYAGVPIHSPDGHAVGTLCVFGDTPHPMADDDLQPLLDLASVVDEIIASRQRANVDELTGLQNRRGFVSAATPLLKLADRVGMAMALAFLDLNGLKRINDELGHEAGDVALAVTAHVLTECFRTADIVARLGGDEFVVLFPATKRDEAAHASERFDAAVAERNARGDLPFELSIAIGIVEREPGGEAIDDLLRRADEAMYRTKHPRRG